MSLHPPSVETRPNQTIDATHHPPGQPFHCSVAGAVSSTGAVDIILRARKVQMALSEQTERAVEACRDAVLMPALWPDALHQLAGSLGAASCAFLGHDKS